MNHNKVDYLLAVVPPKKIIEKVNRLRTKYAQKKSYKIVRHITIYPPFRISSLEIIQPVFKGIKPINVKLDGFSFFKGTNNIVFLKPDKVSSNFLKKLMIKIRTIKKEITDVYGEYPKRLIPHMTIAERIPDEKLPEIKKGLSKIKINLSFRVSSVFLLKQNPDSKIWTIIKEIQLGQ